MRVQGAGECVQPRQVLAHQDRDPHAAALDHAHALTPGQVLVDRRREAVLSPHSPRSSGEKLNGWILRWRTSGSPVWASSSTAAFAGGVARSTLPLPASTSRRRLVAARSRSRRADRLSPRRTSTPALPAAPEDSHSPRPPARPLPGAAHGPAR